MVTGPPPIREVNIGAASPKAFKNSQIVSADAPSARQRTDGHYSYDWGRQSHRIYQEGSCAPKVTVIDQISTSWTLINKT